MWTCMVSVWVSEGQSNLMGVSGAADQALLDRNPCYCHRHSWAGHSSEVETTLSWREQWSLGGKSHQHPDWPWRIPQTCVVNHSPAITHKGPPLYPLSEWCGILPWAPRFRQWCMPVELSVTLHPTPGQHTVSAHQRDLVHHPTMGTRAMQWISCQRSLVLHRESHTIGTLNMTPLMPNLWNGYLRNQIHGEREYNSE